MKGKFKPKNPQKYRGDTSNIVYRSSWELKFMMQLDGDSNVVNWQSEELVIPYVSPIDGKAHRYYPDFVVKKKNKDGLIETVVVEIKPMHQTKQPTPSKTINKRYITEVQTWGINSAKWKAAGEYCEDRKWKFIILTEKELGIKF
jgi:hypothetical protein